MSTVECPSGHESADPEWCDTCGAKIGGTAPVAPPPATPAASVAGAGSGAPPVACPHCSELNPSDALFCEVCGYDFTTGQAPPSSPPPAAHPVEPHIDLSVNWIVVVEVSPPWFELKGALADAPCPPVSSSTVPLTDHTALIGRSSASRGVRPELTLDADTGVSRRHAQFVRNGEMLTVVDLSSTNGTYVVPAGEEPGDTTLALVPGVPVELSDGDRVFLGAWTSLTVRSSPA